MTNHHSPSRRELLSWIGAGTAFSVLAACGNAPAAQARAGSFRITYSDAEWRQRLGKARYHILREAGTERPYSSPLDKEKRTGTFHCAGCNNAAFSSTTKFNSRTGWPSFWTPLKGGVGTSTDYKLGYPRTEVHCADCGGHLGHVFNDGPKPTGKRYCINGLALTFTPA